LAAAVEAMLDDMDDDDEPEAAADVGKHVGEDRGEVAAGVMVGAPSSASGPPPSPDEGPPSAAASSSGIADPPPSGGEELRPAHRRRRAADTSADERVNWDRLYYPGTNGYIRLSQTRGSDFWDMRSVCHKHPGCLVSRRCKTDPRTPAKGRPLALLWSFLAAADEYSTKDEHTAAIKSWGSFQRRSASRRELIADPRAKRWLECERPPFGPKPNWMP
jgi:hypothetical protein